LVVPLARLESFTCRVLYGILWVSVTVLVSGAGVGVSSGVVLSTADGAALSLDDVAGESAKAPPSGVPSAAHPASTRHAATAIMTVLANLINYLFVEEGMSGEGHRSMCSSAG
jgi:hypothetical protein